MYSPTIGLEIHTELNTKTKMFCGCLNDPDQKNPNTNVCPICLGHPGILPVINKKAIESMIKVGLVLQSEIARFSKFDRKNYFYPDLPKGYQISQYDLPICLGGFLNVCLDFPKENIATNIYPDSDEQGETPIVISTLNHTKKIRITRIHLEEDAGRSIHGPNGSLVDFNRAGIPLMELVTEPDLKSAEEARDFAQKLQTIFQYLEISNANLEKGEMRCEVNISLSQDAQLGTKVEIKNLNSFQAVSRSIEYEIKRQSEILDRGEKVIQETRGFDENKNQTFSQRLKESAHDYRYFPEPDLPPLILTEFDQEKIKKEIPELPDEKQIRFKKEFNLKDSDITIITSQRPLAEFFEEAISEFIDLDQENIKLIQLLANYFNNDLMNLMKELNINIKNIKLTPENFAELIALLAKDKISSRVAKDLLAEMVKSDTQIDPRELIKEKGLIQISDASQIQAIIKKVLAKNEKIVLLYKSGKTQVIEALIGQVMKETKGRANPKIIKEMIIKMM